MISKLFNIKYFASASSCLYFIYLNMLNFQVALPKDLKEAARIEKARQYEEQRKARIFNPRQRLIGVRTILIKGLFY